MVGFHPVLVQANLGVIHCLSPVGIFGLRVKKAWWILIRVYVCTYFAKAGITYVLTYYLHTINTTQHLSLKNKICTVFWILKRERKNDVTTSCQTKPVSLLKKYLNSLTIATQYKTDFYFYFSNQ